MCKTSYFQIIDICVRSNQLLKYNRIKVLQIKRNNRILKITHYSHISDLNSLLKRPPNRQNSKKSRFWGQIERKRGPKPLISNRNYFLWVWGRVFHFLLFSNFWPLKRWSFLKTTHLQLWKKSPSRLYLKIDPKIEFWPIFFSKLKILIISYKIQKNLQQSAQNSIFGIRLEIGRFFHYFWLEPGGRLC